MFLLKNLYNDINSRKPEVQNLSALMKKLAQLCLPDDNTFISEQTNQITAHVDTLSDSTEARRELLDTRLQSWQVFPVEEAKDVQDFLDDVAMAIVEDENEEELSAEDLMEKLRQLEVCIKYVYLLSLIHSLFGCYCIDRSIVSHTLSVKLIM